MSDIVVEAATVSILMLVLIPRVETEARSLFLLV